ncbi:acyl-protein thioesterase 1 [Grosmannia clavigera kw1407]|uniref:Acyl-protein thioesterase 1 n=2 Tax=Ophiostomataceae TaxID=5152 RepID=F0XJ54_GROCL|nr:acyl-protein thioesterase 1 [Grosmannia clavigera kw1407]EFX02214.1 acyl-protein thioesterase 1 [Grosmannia clavigera kw1407]
MVSRAAPLVFPATARHTATVIFAHGLGDSGHGWAAAVENWRRRQRLEEVKFVLPHAPNIPITVNGGMRMPGWYDIVSFDSPGTSLRDNEDEAGLVASRAYFHQLVQQEIDAGVPAERIVLGGFSQGGAMAIFAGITNPRRLAGIVAMSTYLVLSQKIESKYLPSPNANAYTPVLWCHGTADPVLPYKMGELSRDALRRMGYPVEWKSYPGMAHSALPEELDDVESFLFQVLPPQAGGKQEL